MKECRTCGEIKPLDQYRVRTQNLDGRNNQCKVCESEYQKKYKKGYRARQDLNHIESEHISLTGIRKSEWCQAYRILSKIGYNPELDIHSQFIERHPHLVLKPRPRKSPKMFTWDDCK